MITGWKCLLLALLVGLALRATPSLASMDEYIPQLCLPWPKCHRVKKCCQRSDSETVDENLTQYFESGIISGLARNAFSFSPETKPRDGAGDPASCRRPSPVLETQPRAEDPAPCRRPSPVPETQPRAGVLASNL
ncbi:GL18817 [Drosophila persimilis]|uniref:GL18817 n=1 Tax=Drosophila persimilis TaxID=7234 RepID=B4G8K7_DROPE|nr:GL18817 [Drosophila persimilis]